MTKSAPDAKAPQHLLMQAAAILAVDPHGIGGAWLDGRRGGAMERWLAALQELCAALGPVKRVPVSISDGRLLGGLDLSATLAQGRPVAERGLLAEADGGLLFLSNVESARALPVAALCAALDSGRTALERDGLTQVFNARFGVVAIHEGAESSAPALRERLGLILNFEGVAAFAFDQPAADTIREARSRLDHVKAAPDVIEALCATALAFDAGTVRTPLLALRVARAAAALAGRTEIAAEDATLAVQLVILPRATRLPAEPADEDDTEQPPPPPAEDEHKSDDSSSGQPLDEKALDEMLIAAALATLPSGVLETLKQAASGRRAASGIGRSGAQQKTRLHGRRSRSRRGNPRDGAPLDVLETIRAAAPWQKLRRMELASAPMAASVRSARNIEVRGQDFRVRTFKSHRETVAIFVVDASGSAALHRLAEAKGAIELLLADCYSRRDHVALIAFRGKAAELLLPPTRSLARVKKLLAALPGGGGTPLALATECAALLAESVQRKGQTPTVVFLTDGKANIDRNGIGSRERGEADALEAAKAFEARKLSSLVIDTSPRPAPQARRFAAEMNAAYLPLPHANAEVLSEAVRAELKPVARAG